MPRNRTSIHLANIKESPIGIVEQRKKSLVDDKKDTGLEKKLTNEQTADYREKIECLNL